MTGIGLENFKTCYDARRHVYYDENPYLGCLTHVRVSESDDIKVGFCRGNFNPWAILYVRHGRQIFLYDYQCFDVLKFLGERYRPGKVLTDFLYIYDQTTAEFDPSVLDTIDFGSYSYEGNDIVAFQCIMRVLYLAMISEVHYYINKGQLKKRSILGKKIKLVGVWQVLFDDMPTRQAANWSRQKPWRVINEKFNRIDSFLQAHGWVLY